MKLQNSTYLKCIFDQFCGKGPPFYYGLAQKLRTVLFYVWLDWAIQKLLKRNSKLHAPRPTISRRMVCFISDFQVCKSSLSNVRFCVLIFVILSKNLCEKVHFFKILRALISYLVVIQLSFPIVFRY